MIANLSDEEVRANFPGGKFLNCELGEDFLAESYIDVGYQTVSATKAEGVENRQFCIGFATPEGDQGSAYMEMRTTEHPAIDEAKTTSLRSFDEPQLAGWQYIARDNESGTRVCAVYGLEKTPLEHIYITSIGDCTLVEPLVRNLHDLALRYQESTGEAAPDSAYIGPGDRPADLAIDKDYADKLDAAQSIKEVGRFEHEIDGDLELKVSNFKQKGDEAMDLGILCFDVEFNKKLSMTQPPNLVMHQPDGSHILARAAQAPGSGSKKVNYCSEQALLFTNADVVIGASEDSLSPSTAEASRYKPLWKIHTEIRDSEITVTD